VEEQGAPVMTHETELPDRVPAGGTVPAGSTDTALFGDPRVDAALRSLDTLSGRPVDEHPAVFEQVHASLVEVLGDLRSDVGSPGTGP
jgi:hypothetical protein